ncbi:hypothetical protein DFH27DRAFT_180813 [Peziza echinospora]|nr:hypothetical protein DFH27DRAFT_180813 [Peziza echinospora]
MPSIFMPHMAPLLTYSNNSPVAHWSDSPRSIRNRSVTARGESSGPSTTLEEQLAQDEFSPPSPRYYSVAHQQTDRELQTKFRQELLDLRKKQQQDCWAKRWNLHSKLQSDIDVNRLHEKHALELTNDEIVKQNTRDKFAYLRKTLVDKYIADKEKLPFALAASNEQEEQRLRAKYKAESIELRKNAKTAFHLEVFDKILTDSAAEDSSTDQSQEAAKAEGSNSGEQNPTALDTDQQADTTSQVQSNQDGSEQPSANISNNKQPEKTPSITSKVSAGSKQSVTSARSRRSEQLSIPSSIRLEDTPLITKKPQTPAAATEEPARPASPDPVPVKRNFWGRIIIQ